MLEIKITGLEKGLAELKEMLRGNLYAGQSSNEFLEIITDHALFQTGSLEEIKLILQDQTSAPTNAVDPKPDAPAPDPAPEPDPTPEPEPKPEVGPTIIPSHIAPKGVVYTGMQNKLIDALGSDSRAAPGEAAESPYELAMVRAAFPDARFMAVPYGMFPKEMHYEWTEPNKWGKDRTFKRIRWNLVQNILPCVIVGGAEGDAHPWAGDGIRPKSPFSRFIEMAQVHPGLLFFLFEFFDGVDWPRKAILPSELFPDKVKPEEDRTFEAFDVFMLARYRRVGYMLADSFFQSVEALEPFMPGVMGRTVYEASGEEWGWNLREARNAKIMGAMDAHKEHVLRGGKCALSSGALQVTQSNVSWAGGDLSDSIETYPIELLEYLNETGGWVSMNMYPKPPKGKEIDKEHAFAAVEDVANSPDVREVKRLRDYLDADGNTSVKVALTEWGWTSGGSKDEPTKERLARDRRGLEIIWSEVSPGLDAAFYYQATNHPGTEGKFTPLDAFMDLEWWGLFNKSHGQASRGVPQIKAHTHGRVGRRYTPQQVKAAKDSLQLRNTLRIIDRVADGSHHQDFPAALHQLTQQARGELDKLDAALGLHQAAAGTS